MKILNISALLMSLLLISCNDSPPLFNDGNSKLTLFAFRDSTGHDGHSNYVPLKHAKIFLVSEYGTSIRYADENGKLEAENLPSSVYQVVVKTAHPDDPNIMFVGTLTGMDISPEKSKCDTIIAKPVSSSGISINEVYYSGPVNNIFYFYDQFLELYNSSDSIKYLDGMIVGRLLSDDSKGAAPGEDVDNDNVIDGIGIGRLFKFPGKPGEKNFPFLPKSFILLASDAADHRSSVPGSIDLRNAQWEFFNQYSANDIDNPVSANLINMRSEQTADFLLNLIGDVVVITNGCDSTWEDGLDISTIIDGVEYQDSSNPKTLSSKVDRGYVSGPPRYSGRSVQRREPGMDSNDGSIDWEIIPAPTPGY